MEPEMNKNEEIVDAADPNATYITLAGGDLVQLVQESGAQVSYNFFNLMWQSKCQFFMHFRFKKSMSPTTREICKKLPTLMLRLKTPYLQLQLFKFHLDKMKIPPLNSMTMPEVSSKNFFKCYQLSATHTSLYSQNCY